MSEKQTEKEENLIVTVTMNGIKITAVKIRMSANNSEHVD
jgi:hypothetical protein